MVGLDRGEVVAADDGVAEPVAREALTGAVADVLEPGVAGLAGAGLRRLDEAEVATDVDRLLGDGHRVDAVEVPGDPQRLHVGVLEGRGVERVGHRGVADRRRVTTRAAGHDEVGVVGRDVGAVDPGDTADPTEVQVPQGAAERQQLLGGGVDDAHAEPVLAVDLPAGVHDEELAVVVGELELRDAELAVDADAAGEVVVEGRVDGARRGVHRGQAGLQHAVDAGERPPTYSVELVAASALHLVVGAVGEAEARSAAHRWSGSGWRPSAWPRR